tara:strand:- start:70 stop:1818 length:1749 start_codon:yes stop_codon:yes gene_type:complete
MLNDKYEGALDWARNEITQEKFEEVLKREATYKGADADESYARKIAHIKIKAGNSLKHLKAGKQNKAIAELLSLYHVLADEFTKDFNTICEYTESGKQKRVIEQTESIEEVAEVLDVSEEAIESLGEGVEVLDEELDHIQRDYHSQTKRESRSFAFDRRLIKTRGNNGEPAGAKQTKAARTALFMPSAEMIDLVQAWEEGVINKNTQLVLVEVDADRATHMEENFQAILAKTTERINEDPERNVQVPTFKNKPRFYKNSVLRLRPNSKVWKDITLDYAFLDYTCSCSESHLRWVQNVLYKKLSATSTAAFTHYSTARGKKDVEGSASSWRNRKILMLRVIEMWVNLIMVCTAGGLKQSDNGKGTTISIRQLFTVFMANLPNLLKIGTKRTSVLLNQIVGTKEQNEYSLSYIDWVCIASSFSDAASTAGDKQFALVFEENGLAFRQPTIHEYIGTEGATMVTYRFDIQKECKVTEYNRLFVPSSILMGYGVMGVWKMKAPTLKNEVADKEIPDEDLFSVVDKLIEMHSYDQKRLETMIAESELDQSKMKSLLGFLHKTMPEHCDYTNYLWSFCDPALLKCVEK